MRPGATPSTRRVPSISINTTRSLCPTARAPTIRSRFPAAAPPLPMRRSSQAHRKMTAMMTSRASATLPIAARPDRCWGEASAVDIGAELAGAGANTAASGVEALQAFGRRDDLGDADAVLVVDHHHLALGHQVIVDEDVHRLARQAVQLRHRTARQFQQLLDG